VAHFVSVLYLPKLKGAWQFDNIASFSALVKYWYSKIFSIQVKNGQDYQSGMTLNKA
jgi:hypothetical protein